DYYCMIWHNNGWVF
nr:immunoglobulin light chain junction region [Macaca mulatta]MOX28836.1 immunoglobulin light chain junction region [Macaca mulatta]MOX29544.1 immunoglobulin light chain junction region [Macaca mulatta]MOX33034.1 immunoglobulin light chain junction region [Macaca mulatta]MOY05136.1 immunoglobulin light chain junction region [Macaca mulatta]